MTGLRDLIRNPRVAAVVAVAAVLFVGYRVYQGMPGSGRDPHPAGSVAAPGPADREAPPGGGGRAPALRDTIHDSANGVGSTAGETSDNGAPPVGGLTRLPGGAASRGKGAAVGAPGPRREAPWAWDRNPFLPAEKTDLLPRQLLPGLHGWSSGEAKGARRLDLQVAFHGTVVSGGQGVAIFGDRIVSEGGVVGGWTVDKVEPYRVVVRHGTESRTLEMFRPSPPARRGEKEETP